MDQTNKAPTKIERIKSESRRLRGTIGQCLADETTGALSPDDVQIAKFHGIYQQDDRDLRAERKQRKLGRLHTFMLRARVPGGVATPKQWLAIDEIASTLTGGTLRLTTRQTFQYHGILKGNIKPVIQGINRVMLDSIAACGDVNRNVLCNPNPVEARVHREVYRWAVKISGHLLPKTRAYYEIWLDEEKIADSREDEPLYGETYLPRKFKVAIAVPPHNDVDVYANDLGFVAIVEEGCLKGFNVLVGGGMGMNHSDKNTFPRLADEIGFLAPEHTLAVAEAVVSVQRDFGDRTNRRRARMKYTIETMGLEAFKAEVESRAGIVFEPPRPVEFTSQGDRYGWVRGVEGRWHLTLFIENGRIRDRPGEELLSGLRRIARVHQGDFRMTANQNLIVANVPAGEKSRIEELARAHGLLSGRTSPARRQSMACVALPTCSLALAEAERYLPTLLDKIEALLSSHGMAEQSVVIRMTGCPNGCARPYLAEIGLVGKAPGKYNLYLGGDGKGTRLNRLFLENIAEAEILAALDRLFEEYGRRRLDGEGIGDFAVRSGMAGNRE